MSPLAQPIVAPDEYLRLERAAAYKSEFVNGRIYAMAGASRAHNQILFNLAREVGTQIRGRACDAFVADMRVKVSQTGMYTYPDLVALCDEARFEDENVDTLLNPSVIIEVLSDSTEKYDRGDKFAHFRRLESLREYILVSQERPRVEQYVRTAQVWTFQEIDRLDDSLTIEALGCTIALGGIYDRVVFPAETRERG